LASKPGGRENVKSLTPSVAGLGANVASNPTVAGFVPAVVLVGVTFNVGVIVADATAGSASTAAVVTSPTRARLSRIATGQIPPLMMSV
jgi:hypothetical protein